MVYGIPESELRKRLTAKDFIRLVAADNVGLIPDPWLQTGMICATIANVHQDKKSETFNPDDFIPQRKREPENINASLLEGFEHRRGQSGNRS